jgi:competence protein ComEA
MKKIVNFLVLTAIITAGYTVVYDMPVLHAAPKADVKIEAQAQPVVNINKATAEELQTLRGIGPALADRILKYRETNGRFEKVEDLSQVNGIGEAKFQKIKAQVTL